MVNAVVLAGNPKEEEDKRIYNLNKALIEISNKPLIGYVIDALKDSNVNKIVVVGPKKSLEERIQPSERLEFIEESSDDSRVRSFVENLVSSYRKAANHDGVIYLTCDIPLITPYRINRDIERFKAAGSDLVLMLTNQKLIPKQFARLKKNGPLKLDGEGYRWSNMFFVNNVDTDKLLLDMIDITGSALSLRRLESLDSKMKIFSFVLNKFPELGLKYLVGMLRKDDVKKKFYEKFNKKLEILEASSYESSIDIDYERDFEMLKDYITKNKINFERKV